MKQCNKCKEQKPLIDFNRKTDTFDGRTTHCKKCNADRAYKRLLKIKEARQFNLI